MPSNTLSGLLHWSPSPADTGTPWKRCTSEAVIRIQLTISPSPPENLCDLKDLPVWVLHDEKDVDIPHEQTADVLVDALQACGGRVRYTLYPGVGHDAWTETYHDPALYAWLLEQRRQ